MNLPQTVATWGVLLSVACWSGGCSQTIGGSFSIGYPTAAVPPLPRGKILAPFPGGGATLLNMPVRVRQGVDSVILRDIALTGSQKIMKLTGVLELTPGMRLVDVERAVADLDSQLVYDPVISTPEFQGYVIRGKFSSSRETVYYFEGGIFLGVWIRDHPTYEGDNFST